MRLIVAVAGLSVALSVRAEPMPIPSVTRAASEPGACMIVADDFADAYIGNFAGAAELNAQDLPSTPDTMDADQAAAGASAKNQQQDPRPAAGPSGPVDADGKAIPLDRRQPQRILGFMPNFRTVSGGAKPHPPGWKYNFTVATEQATDYSSFIFLGLTSLTAESMNMHAALGKGIGGFYAYTWRGFLDKSDNTYLSAWLLPSLLHEDTRYYALGNEHSIPMRTLYVISRQAVAKTYGGRQTPNFAGLGGKVLAQVFSRYYYPPSATTFPVLASKFGYSVMRDVAFSSIREFYPDIAAHFVRKHQEKMARIAAQAATAH